MPDLGDCTGLLIAWQEGDESALHALIPLVYSELQRLAQFQLRRERADHTLQPSALVHEAFMRINEANPIGSSRTHFLGIASRVMRQVLIDHARGKNAEKRGQGAEHITLVTNISGQSQSDVNLIDLDTALNELAKRDSRKASVVELRYFGGLSIEETADVLDISPATVKREWQFSRAWLYGRLKPAQT